MPYENRVPLKQLTKEVWSWDDTEKMCKIWIGKREIRIPCIDFADANALVKDILEGVAYERWEAAQMVINRFINLGEELENNNRNPNFKRG